MDICKVEGLSSQNSLAWADCCRRQAASEANTEAKAALIQIAEEFEAITAEFEGLVSGFEALTHGRGEEKPGNLSDGMAGTGSAPLSESQQG
jgi:hypothetical protein